MYPIIKWAQIILIDLIEWFHGVVPRLGIYTWFHGVVPWYGASTWCLDVVPRRGALIWCLDVVAGCACYNDSQSHCNEFYHR